MSFINDSFLLKSDAARVLYHTYAEPMPIFDYHCHLSSKEILENKKFETITDLWLSGDHYKWRLMRANGVEEHYITGAADPYEKFLKWAQTVSRSFGNPLYHWTQLELYRYFGIKELLNEESAERIYNACNELLKRDEYRTRELIRFSGVTALCTTDDPADDLKDHIALEDEGFPVQVLPAFRPDKALHPEEPGFPEYIKRLGEVVGREIETFDDLKVALSERAKFFKLHGCLLSDHGFGAPNFIPGEKKDGDEAFRKVVAGEVLTQYEIDRYQTQLMLYLGGIYDQLGFAMQLHLGVIRDTNTVMKTFIGSNAGFDAIGENLSIESVLRLLDMMEKSNILPKTVLYSLNPNDNDRLAVAAGCFQRGPDVRKIQLGAAWWFNDHRDGMVNQMKALANTGILANFIGMLTDSRSFVSYTRHEYFRRILCNLIGEWMTDGEIPNDFELIGKVIEDICYNNAVNYFSLPKHRIF